MYQHRQFRFSVENSRRSSLDEIKLAFIRLVLVLYKTIFPNSFNDRHSNVYRRYTKKGLAFRNSKHIGHFLRRKDQNLLLDFSSISTQAKTSQNQVNINNYRIIKRFIVHGFDHPIYEMQSHFKLIYIANFI